MRHRAPSAPHGIIGPRTRRRAANYASVLAVAALMAVAGAAVAKKAPKVSNALPAAALARLPASDDASFVELRMCGERYSPEQAYDAATPVLEIPATQTVLIARDGRFRMETETHYPGAIQFRFLTVGSPQGAATVDPMHWRDGIEIARDGADSARGDQADLLFLAPALLLRDAQERGAIASVEPAAGGLVRVVFTDAAGRPATLTLRADSGLAESAVAGERRYVYSGYRDQGGLQQPAAVELSRDGHPAARWQIDARLLATPAADAFELPSGYVEPAPRGALRATPLGDGVYRVDGAESGYHTGFVVGAKTVAVFDAPISVEEAAKTRALIQRTAPGRRIGYIVVSHVHGDHVAGLPAYNEDGAQVIAGKQAGVALRRQFGGTLALSVSETASPRRLDLGDRVVMVYPLQSTHAESMLVGYDAATRSVFQGDLFYLPETGPVPPAFDGAGELSRLIADEGLRVDHIVGVHGRSGDAKDLAAALKLHWPDAAR